MKDVINMNLRHITNFGGLSVNGTQIAGGAPERTYFVSPNFALNEQSHQSPTIQGGIDMAYADWGDVTDASHVPIILVYPGKYEEQIHLYRHYHIQGFTHESYTGRKTAVIYNTGADEDHYPLRGDDGDNYYIEGINIEVDNGGVIGKLGDNQFVEVHFKYGEFIESTRNDNSYTKFQNCIFFKSGFNLTGATTNGRRTVGLDSCWLYDYTWITTSTHDTDSKFWIANCAFNRSYPNLGGDWYMQVLHSHIFGDTKTQINTTSDLTILDSIISNGLHFITDPANLMLRSCDFADNEGYALVGADVTAEEGVTLTNVDYVGNNQQNGLPGAVQILGPAREVGGTAVNRYINLEAAMDSIATSGIVTLHEDSTEAIEDWSYATDIVINGQGVYSITQEADITVPANGDLEFQQVKTISGHWMTVDDTNATLRLIDCPHVTFTITYIGEGGGGGSRFFMYNSSLYAYAVGPAVIYDTGMYTEIFYSYLFSSGNFPAVQFNVAHTNFKTKYTSYVVSGGGGPPSVNAIASAEVACVIDAYNCGSNMDIVGEYVSNSITANGCIVDDSINF